MGHFGACEENRGYRAGDCAVLLTIDGATGLIELDVIYRRVWALFCDI